VTAAWIGAGIVAAVAASGRPLLFASIDQTVAAARGVRSGCSESASSQSPATPPSFAITAVAAAGYTAALVAARHRRARRRFHRGTSVASRVQALDRLASHLCDDVRRRHSTPLIALAAARVLGRLAWCDRAYQCGRGAGRTGTTARPAQGVVL